MKRSSRSSKLAFALLTLTTCACSSGSADRPLPATQPKPAVEIPKACEDLAQRVSVPKAKVGDNAKVTLAKRTAALTTANGRLEATRGCQARQRETFAKG